jgi:protein SCO1/2
MSIAMKRVFLLGAVMIAALATVVPGMATTNRWGANYFPDLPVVTQDGKTLRFYDDLIKGKIVVVSFFYTSCTDLCPIETARLAEVKDKLGDAVGRDIFFVSLSVDPEHDTPEMLKAFADAFDAAAPGWQFLTGQPEDVKLINGKFGDRSAQRNLRDHRNEILIGNDATGDWQRDSAFDDINQLVTTIRLMDPKWSKPVDTPRDGATSESGYYKLSDQPGQVLFKKMCAPCHTIGGGDHVGPDLRGVADRRDRAWLIDFIRDPARMLARKDPDAVALAARFPAVRMPRMGLGENDASDLIAYLKAETLRWDANAHDTSAGH